jgi:hypothetical protein
MHFILVIVGIAWLFQLAVFALVGAAYLLRPLLRRTIAPRADAEPVLPQPVLRTRSRR